MTVEKLIELLQKFDPKTLVVLSENDWRHNYSPVGGYSEGFYMADNNDLGRFISKKYIDDLSEKERQVEAICLLSMC